MKRCHRRLWLLLAGFAGLISPVLAAEPAAPPLTTAQTVQITGIHNAYRVTPDLYSGSQPEGDAAFAALARLGIKTLVSVDGGKPDLAAARRHGLRYVHLPIGYDGIPTNRVAELIALTTRRDGPFFVHCHHGLHRGPAAVAIVCAATAGWTPAQAETWLREAGTSPDYPGLYRAAREFEPPPPAALAAITDLPEFTTPSSLVEAMVAIDEHFARLKQCQQAGWKAPPGQADISPPHEATLLWEQLRELARLEDTVKRPADYREKLTDAERAAETLRTRLRQSAEALDLDAAFKLVSQTCAACHRQYRNE